MAGNFARSFSACVHVARLLVCGPSEQRVRDVRASTAHVVTANHVVYACKHAVHVCGNIIFSVIV